MLRELALEGGGFASAQDADTDGVEGLTFTWKRDGNVPDQFLNIFEGGRFIIRGELDDELRAELLEMRERAAAAGARRQGDRLVERPRARGARRVRARARPGRLGRRGRGGSPSSCSGRSRPTTAGSTAPGATGVAKGTGYLDDYANVANGLYELHVATGELRWLEESNRLARLAVELFGDDENGGFFETPSDGEQLVVRKKDFDDHPAPSGNSMLAYVLLRLARIYGDDELEERAASFFRLDPARADARCRRRSAGGSSRRPVAVAAARDRDRRRRPTPRSRARRVTRWDPKAVVAFGPADDVPLLEGKTLVDGKPAVYVCERFACQAPVTDPAELTQSQVRARSRSAVANFADERLRRPRTAATRPARRRSRTPTTRPDADAAPAPPVCPGRSTVARMHGGERVVAGRQPLLQLDLRGAPSSTGQKTRSSSGEA